MGVEHVCFWGVQSIACKRYFKVVLVFHCLGDSVYFGCSQGSRNIETVWQPNLGGVGHSMRAKEVA